MSFNISQFCMGEVLDQLLQCLPALLAESKERFQVVARNRGSVSQRQAGDPFDVPFFGGEYVPHQFTNSFKATITMGSGAGLSNLLTVPLKPVIPLLAFPGGVVDEIAQIQIVEHL